MKRFVPWMGAVVFILPAVFLAAYWGLSIWQTFGTVMLGYAGGMVQAILIYTLEDR